MDDKPPRTPTGPRRTAPTTTHPARCTCAAVPEPGARGPLPPKTSAAQLDLAPSTQCTKQQQWQRRLGPTGEGGSHRHRLGSRRHRRGRPCHAATPPGTLAPARNHHPLFHPLWIKACGSRWERFFVHSVTDFGTGSHSSGKEARHGTERWRPSCIGQGGKIWAFSVVILSWRE